MPRSLSSERRLLLACLCRGSRPAGIHELLGGDLDWNRMIDQATHHGVAPLVYSTLRTVAAPATVPPVVLERLAQVYYQQAVLSGQLYAELRKILAACAQVGIRVLVLKGAAMAEPVYEDIALRPMRDLDLLVRREDFGATDRLFHELGYVLDESCGSVAWYRDHGRHRALYRRPDGRTLVEVHQDILPPFGPIRIPIEDLWRRARPASAGAGALVLSPEDLLLHLCLHVSLNHQFSLGLRPVCDIAEAIRHYDDELDWTQARDRACQWAVQKYVYLALRLARDLVDATVPEDVLKSLRPERFDLQVIAWATTHILADERETPSLSRTLAQLCGPKPLWQKGALFLKKTFPSPRILAQRYPACSGSLRIYLYYPILWRDFLRRSAGSAWRLLRLDDAMLALAERERQKAALAEWLGEWPLSP